MDALAATARSRLAAPRRLLRLRSDAYLAERFADGDEAAFSILFERHRPSVLAVCIGVLGSRHDAEDAAQETFASLAVALRSSRPRELRAWLTRVARNSSIDVARRRRTRESINHELSDIVGEDGVSSSQLVKDELESVVAGIRELPESQRTALLMRELAGHSYREIADLLETDEDAVRGLIARARIGLRQYREAAEMPCAAARAAMAAEPDGRRHDRTVRRHVRGCASCRAYRGALRDDARALRGLAPVPAGGAAGGSAVVGLAAKGALLGTAATQVTAACAVSVCAVGGIALLAPALASHHPLRAAISHHPSARPAGDHAVRSLSPSASPPLHASSRAASAAAGHYSSSALRDTATTTPTRVLSFRAVSSGSGSKASVRARGTYTVPAGGHPGGSSQPSSGRGRGAGGRPAQGSAPAQGGPGSAGAPGDGNPSRSGSGTDSAPPAGQQRPATPPDRSPLPVGGAGASGPSSGPGFTGRMSTGEFSGTGAGDRPGHSADAVTPTGQLGPSGDRGSSSGQDSPNAPSEVGSAPTD